MNGTLTVIKLEELRFSDEYFKISRNIIPDSLTRSIRDMGILSPPTVTRADEGYRIIDGFNRLKAVSQSGVKTVDAILVKEIESRDLIRNAALKVFRNEVGAAGKVKFLFILKDFFGMTEEECNYIGRRELGIPADFLNEADIIDTVQGMPLILKDYFDMRDIPFKVLRNYLKLPGEGRKIIADWIDTVHLRVNVFKKAVDMMLDIYRRDTAIKNVEKLSTDEVADPRYFEQYILDGLHKIRYPDYTAILDRVNSLTGKVNGGDIEVRFPEFLEGDSLSLVVRLGRKENFGKLLDKISNLDGESLDELLGLL